MRRGDIFYIEATGYQTTGSEQRPGRPGIIVSNEKCNENSEVVEVVYTTTQPKNHLPTHVAISTTPRPSTALCEQVNSVSKQRIGNYIGHVSKREQENIDIALLVSVDLYIPQETPAGGGQDITGKRPDDRGGGAGAAGENPGGTGHLQTALRAAPGPDFKRQVKEVTRDAHHDAQAA